MSPPYSVGWTNIPFMRNGKNFFVYLWRRIRRKLFSWYVGEKHVGLDKTRQASQKEHVLSLKRLCQLKLSTRSFAGLIPDSGSFNFPSTFACSFIAVFSFLVRFFRFFELVHGHFHGLGLFIPIIITPRKMLAWWLINWVASSNPAKVHNIIGLSIKG